MAGKPRGTPEQLYAAGELPLAFRLSRSERERIGLAAKRGGLTVSAWIRRAMRRVLEMEAAAERRTEAADG